MAGGNIVDEIKQIDNDDNVAKIDSDTNSAYMLPVEHGYIHQGKAFFLVEDMAVDAGETFDILIATPSSVEIHVRKHKVTATTAPGEFCLYESTTISASGDEVTPVNCNRIIDTPSVISAYKNPETTSLGAEIDCDTLTGGKLSGGITTEVAFEWVLKPNSLYLFRYTNASGIKTDANITIFYLEV